MNRSNQSPECGLIDLTAHACAYVFGADPSLIQSATRGDARTAFARQASMYLAHVAFDMPLAQVAHCARRDRSTVSHALRTVERLRDDPVIDMVLDRLEQMLQSAPGPLSDEDLFKAGVL